MSVNWYFYSDTNAKAEELESILVSRKQTLKYIQRLDDLLTRLEQTTYAVLFLRANTIYNVYELCEEISVKYPHIYIVIIAPDNMENMKKAMHVGATDILRYSATNEEITEVIIQAHKYMNHRINQEDVPIMNMANKNSRIISICSAKGGLGRTLLTVNLAAAFAKNGKKVAIIDADLQFGDVAMYYDIKPKQTIYEWVKEGFERGQYGIERYLCKHECGVAILAAPPRPEFFEVITEEHIETAITELKKMYDVILIDQTSSISGIHLKGLVHSDDILLLTTSDIPVLKNSKLYIDMLQTLQLSDKIKLILNRDSRSKNIDNKRVEEIMKIPFFSKLPSQDNLTLPSINEGIPFIFKNARSPLSKGILLLSKQLLEKDNVSLEPVKKPIRRFLLAK
jgi:pilus assembly protein CpaE